MPGMELSEFLLARIAEDEESARAASSVLPSGPDPSYVSLADGLLRMQQRFDPARVLAECEAKRFVIDALRGYEPSDEWGVEPDIGKRANNAAGALRRMALPYADHPDYDEEWRP